MRRGLDWGIVTGLVVLALMTVGVGFTSFVNTRGIRSDADEVTHSRQVIEAVAEVRAAVRRVQAEQRAFLITGFPEWEPPYHAAADDLRAAAAELATRTSADPEQRPRAEAVSAEVNTGLTNLNGVVKLRGGPNGYEAVVALSRERGRVSFVDPLLQTLEEMENVEHDRLAYREEEARQAFRQANLYTVVGVVLGLVALGLFVLMLWRNVRARQSDAGRLAEQRELLTATLSSIGDGVIATDSTGRVTFLNGVAQTLTGWTQADATGRPLTEVFRIVNETTREVVENPAVRALEKGVIVGLANHTVLISRDGVERPIDDSAAPIRVGGRVGGAVLVFRDITERKAAEAALREGEERLRSVFDAMQEGFCLIQPVFDADGNPTDYRYLLTNPALERHTGLVNVVGKTARQVMPAHEQGWIDEYARVALTGEPFRREGRVEDLGAWYEVSAVRVGDPALRQVGVVFADVSDRQRAAEAVRASEQQLADVFRHAPSFMAVLRGPDHVFERVNDHYSRLVAGREVVGKTVAEALPEVVGQGFVTLLDRVYQTGEPHIGTGTRVLLDPGGGRVVEQRVLDFVYQARRGASGEVTGILVQGIDLTERTRVEAAVRERDERLQVFLGAATDYAVVIADRQGRVVEWLGGAEAITGYSPAEAVGQSAELLFTPEDRAAGVPEREMATAARDGRAEDKRWHQKKNGDQFYADGVMVSLRTEGGELHGFGKVFRDATARKRAEDAVRFLADASASLAELVDYESTLHRIANLAVTGFADWCVVDVLDGKGTRRRLAVTQAETAEVSSARAADAASPPGAIDGGVPHVLLTGEPEVVPDLAVLEQTTGLPGGERIERLRGTGVRSYLCVPLLSRGRVIGGITFLSQSARRRLGSDQLRVAEDLAGRVTAAIENAQLYRDLQEQDRRKDEFLATLAHELRNPLAPVRNGVQILRVIVPPDEQTEQTLAMMERQLGHMVHLVDDLMDVARVSSGKVVLRPEAVDVRAVIDAAVEATRPLVEASGHELTVDLPPEPLSLRADRTRLVQVMTNLLSNAAKYTPQGGRIAVTAERADGQAVVRVADTGVGITADMLPKVFDLFTQVGTSLERSQGGLGIGLTLVKRLAEMHGGSVSAESAGAKLGSTFTVRLPLTAGSATVTEPSDTAGPLHAKRLSVLVVDDNVDAAESMVLLLGLKGHEVRTAHDGPEALRVLAIYRPHLILLDIGLPGMNGYEIARRIRESEAHRGVTLAALTGWGQEEDRRRSREAGFDYHLTKPADLAELDKVLAASAAR